MKQTRNDINKDNNCQNIIEKSNDNDVTVGTLFTMLSKRSWIMMDRVGNVDDHYFLFW